MIRHSPKAEALNPIRLSSPYPDEYNGGGKKTCYHLRTGWLIVELSVVPLSSVWPEDRRWVAPVWKGSRWHRKGSRENFRGSSRRRNPPCWSRTLPEGRNPPFCYPFLRRSEGNSAYLQIQNERELVKVNADCESARVDIGFVYGRPAGRAGSRAVFRLFGGKEGKWWCTLLVGYLVEAVLKNLVEMKWFIITSRHFALTSVARLLFSLAHTRKSSV